MKYMHKRGVYFNTPRMGHCTWMAVTPGTCIENHPGLWSCELRMKGGPITIWYERTRSWLTRLSVYLVPLERLGLRPAQRYSQQLCWIFAIRSSRNGFWSLSSSQKRMTVRRKRKCLEKNTLCFCLNSLGRFVKCTIFKETITCRSWWAYSSGSETCEVKEW